MGRRREVVPMPPEVPGEGRRLQLARQVRRLLEANPELMNKQLAQELGVSRQYVGDLLADPTGELMRERHERARGTCADCGAPTAWPGGDGAPTRCDPCARAIRAAAHGTPSRYTGGCRCDACRKAASDHQAEYQRRRYHQDPEYRARRLAAHRAWLASPKGQAYLERQRQARRA